MGLTIVYLTSGTEYTSKEDNGTIIKFNYPDGWRFNEFKAGVHIQGEKNDSENGGRAVVTINKIPANGTSVDKIKKENSYMRTGKILNQTDLEIDGIKTTLFRIQLIGGPERGKLGEATLVIFKKEDYLYSISFVSGGSLEKIEPDIEHILNSFHVSHE